MEELDPLFAEVIYDENGELNNYARAMQEEFPDVDPKAFAHLRYGMEYEAQALLGSMANHFGAFAYARMETAVEKYLATEDTQPVPLPAPTTSPEVTPEATVEVDLAGIQQENNTKRFKDKALEVAANAPSQLLNASGDFARDVFTQPVRTVTGTVDNAGKMVSGAVNTGKDAPDVVNYAFKRLDMGLGNAVARGVGAVGNEGDARNKGWERIFAVQRAIDAIPGPALGMASTGVRLPINSEDDLEFYKSLGINPRNAKVGGYMDRSINITKLDQIAERFGTTAEQMQITGGEAAVSQSYNEVDTALGALIGDASAFAGMTVMTGGGNLLVRSLKDGAIEAASYTEIDPGFTESILLMAGFDQDEIPELLKVAGKEDLSAMGVRFVEGATMSLAMEALGGFLGKLKRGEFPDQQTMAKAAEETSVLLKEAAAEQDEIAKAAAKAAQEAVDEFDAAVAVTPTVPAKANPDVQIPEFPKSLSGAKPKYRNMYLEFESETAKALYIVGGNGKSAHHDRFMEFLEETLGTDKDWAAVGTRMRQAMKENYVEGGTFQVELPYEARFDVAKSTMAKDAVNDAPTPKTLEITSNMESIVEDLAIGKHLEDLDDKAIDVATGIRDFRNYPFLETVGKTTDAIKRNLENSLSKQPTTVNAMIQKADLALTQLRKEYGTGALPSWALDKISTGSQASDVLARIISIKTTNDQIVRLSEYLHAVNKGATGTQLDKALSNLGGLSFISKAENPREMASWYLTKLIEGAEDLNGAYNKISRDWGQTGVILRKLKQGIQDQETAQNMERLIKREMDKGYISPDEAAKRIEDFKTANRTKLNKYADASEGDLLSTLTKSQYSSLLLNVPTMMVNLTSEVARTVGYATISPIANAMELFRRGKVGKAGLEAGRLIGQVALAPAQMGKVARNVRDVWATGMGNIQRELTPYTASTNKALTLGEVFGERAARETLLGKVGIVPARVIDVGSAVTMRTMATISETIGTIFVGANTDYSVLVGQYGKKWQDRMLKEGFLDPDDITEMLAETGGGRRIINGQLIDEDLAEASAAFRFQDNIDGTAVGALENAYNKASRKAKWMKWVIPFFGIGARITEETLTMSIPGLAFLNKGRMSTVAAKRMGLGQFAGPVTTPSQRAWRYYYGAMQVNMATSMLQGLEDYESQEHGIPPLPENVGDTTEVFQPVSGRFGEFGGGVVTFENLGDNQIRRVEEKSMELMNSDTVSYIWRNLGYHLALMGDEQDATDTGEAMTRLMSSQINTVLGASVARTLPSEFSKLTGQNGGKGIYEWMIGKIGGQVPLGSGYRNMKKVWKEYFGDPEYVKAYFEDGVVPYTAERMGWIGDLAKTLYPSWFLAANKDLGFAGYPNSKGRRGNIDPTTKVTELPRSVIIANWVAEQQGRKMLREEWTIPGTEVLLRDIEGPSGFSLFTDVVELTRDLEMPHPVDGRMLTMTAYMDGELDNPQSDLRKSLAERGINGEEILKVIESWDNPDDDNKDHVAALQGGNVIWEFIKDTQKRYNDMALAELIHGLPKETKEDLLRKVEMTMPEFWYDHFPLEVRARLNLIRKGEGTVIDGEFRLFE